MAMPKMSEVWGEAGRKERQPKRFFQAKTMGKIEEVRCTLPKLKAELLHLLFGNWRITVLERKASERQEPEGDTKFIHFNPCPPFKRWEAKAKKG